MRRPAGTGGLPGHSRGGPGYVTRLTPCRRHEGDTGLVKKRFAVPVRAWLGQAWAFARSAEPQAPLSRRACLTDIAIAAVALVASLLAVRATYGGQPAQYALDPHTGAVVVVGVTQVQQVWQHALPAVLFTSLPLAARRRFPLSAFVVLLAGALATQKYATDVTFLAIVFSGYSAVAHSRFRGAALLSMIPAGLIVAVSFWNGQPPSLMAHPVPQAKIFLSGPGAGVVLQANSQWRLPGLVAAFSLILIAVIGNAMQARDRIRRMQAEHAAATRRALDEERALIASELHDVVTHNVSVMIVQAGAARQVLAADPAEATAALLAVEASGRAAMTELRHLLGLLSPAGTGAGPDGGPALDGAETGQDLSPQPGLGQLKPLIDRLDAAGLPVELQVGGAPRALPPGLDLAAYRVVQEALTNVLKHAGKPRTTVRLDYRDADLVVEVADAGPPIPAAGPAPSAVPGSGRGLLGLRERIALYGGELDAGPRPGGGWLVRARLPVDPAASAGAAEQPAAGLASPAARQR
jgi:signal transduction histidine kinase